MALIAFLLASGFQLSFDKLIDPVFAFSISLLLFLFSIFFRKYVLRQKYLSEVLVFLSLFCFFLAWVCTKGLWYLDQRLPESLEGKEVYVEGYVSNLPKRYFSSFKSSNNSYVKRQDFDFHVDELRLCEGNQWHGSCSIFDWRRQAVPERMFALGISDFIWRKIFPEPVVEKIRLSIYRQKPDFFVKGGQRYRFLVKLKRPRSSLNFQGFDYETWLFTQAYHAKGYVRAKGNNDVLGESFSSLAYQRERIRDDLLLVFSKKNAQSNGSQPSVAQSLILALALGDRSYLSKETNKLLVNTGTAHLLAISGMHIALVSYACFFLFFIMIRSVKWGVSKFFTVPAFLPIFFSQRLAACFALMMALVYALAAGFSLPTQRALIMVACYTLGLLLVRKTGFYLLWVFALLLVLLHDPFALLDGGLYLSFGAVLLIQWFILGRFQAPAFASGLNDKLNLMFRSQWAVYLGLSPFLIFLFANFFLASLLCNLLAIPLVSFMILP
jgi:ComEC/Rec2-related protein